MSFPLPFRWYPGHAATTLNAEETGSESRCPKGTYAVSRSPNAGLRDGETLSFLARYGRGFAGALQVWDLDDPTEPRTPELRALTDADIGSLLQNRVTHPLANDPLLRKSSLGGVQPKIVLVKTESGWAQALAGHPSTHIRKPQLSGHYSNVILARNTVAD